MARSGNRKRRIVCGRAERKLLMMPAIALLLFMLLGGIAVRHLARTFFYPRPAKGPAALTGDVEAALARFEAALAAHAPGVLCALRPGLADERIRAIEREYGLRLTDDLRALYRWRDGSASDDGVDLIPGHWFVPLEEAARMRVEQRRQVAAAPFVQRAAFAIFAGHRTGWLPVLDDGAGDGYFYDPGRRRACALFYHFAEDRDYRFFPSLGNFLGGAAECYETGIYRVGRRGEIDEDYERSFELWPRYASSPGG